MDVGRELQKNSEGELASLTSTIHAVIKRLLMAFGTLTTSQIRISFGHTVFGSFIFPRAVVVFALMHTVVFMEKALAGFCRGLGSFCPGRSPSSPDDNATL